MCFGLLSEQECEQCPKDGFASSSHVVNVFEESKVKRMCGNISSQEPGTQPAGIRSEAATGPRLSVFPISPALPVRAQEEGLRIE